MYAVAFAFVLNLVYHWNSQRTDTTENIECLSDDYQSVQAGILFSQVKHPIFILHICFCISTHFLLSGKRYKYSFLCCTVIKIKIVDIFLLSISFTIMNIICSKLFGFHFIFLNRTVSAYTRQVFFFKNNSHY